MPCHLQLAVGRVEACSGDDCPFWESGGAVVGPSCGLERVGLVGELEAKAAIVEYLFDLRARLEQVSDVGDERELRSRFYRLLNEGDESAAA